MNETFDSSFNNVLTYRVFKLKKSRSVWKWKQLQLRMQLQAKVLRTLEETVWKKRYEITTNTVTFARWKIVQDREISYAIYNKMLKDRSM